VIGKVCQRGQRVSGLLHYLYATGPAQQEGRNRRNPHVDPRRRRPGQAPSLPPDCEACGAPGGRGHQGQHVAGQVGNYLNVDKGVPARVVMELLGHSQITLTLGTYYTRCSGTWA